MVRSTVAENKLNRYSRTTMDIVKRRRLVYGIVAVIVIVATWAGYQSWKNTDPYRGLAKTFDVQMDEATRSMLVQRMATTQASINAFKAAGEEVNTDLYLSLASDAYFLGDLVAARENIEIFLNENAIYFVAWNTYGNILAKMGDLEPAERAYEQAIRLSGGMDEYYLDYADFLERYFPERDEDVKAILEQAVAVLGQKDVFMVRLAEWYLAHDDCDRALSHYEVALDVAENENVNASIREDYQKALEQCTNN